MRVEVEVVCAPHPRDRVKAALRAAGKQLASAADSVSVQVRPTAPPTVQRIAVLEFEMRRAAQYKCGWGITDESNYTERGVSGLRGFSGVSDSSDLCHSWAGRY